MSVRPGESGTVRSAHFFDHGIFLVHLNRGKELLRQGNHEGARQELEEARRLRSQDPEVLANLAFTLFHLGHYDDAESLTRNVLAAHPLSVPLLFNLGLILFKAGRPADAKDPLLRVLQLAPSHRKAHLTLGLVFRKLGETAKAAEHFRLAGRPDGDDDDTLSRLARAAVAEKEKDAADAAAASMTAVKPERFDDAPGHVDTTAAPTLEAEPRPAARDEREEPEGEVARRVGPFSSEPGGFLAAETEGGLLVRREAITGRRGLPVLEAETALPPELSGLFFRARGKGTLFLVERGRRPHFVSVGAEFLSVDPRRILALDRRLGYRADPALEFRRPGVPWFLKLLGDGAVALAVRSTPARFLVTRSEPLTLAADAVVAYAGDLDLEPLETRSLYSEFGGRLVFRFAGVGSVLVEG